MDMLEHAKDELKRVHIDLDSDKDNYAHMLGKDVYNVLEYISDQKHSGESLAELMLLLNQLVYGKALSVITGNIDEWATLDDNTLVNTRDSRITKDIKSNKVYFNDAYHFYEPKSCVSFTCEYSNIEIHLPILPQDLKTKYVQLLIKPSIFPIKWQLKLHLYRKLSEKV